MNERREHVSFKDRKEAAALWAFAARQRKRKKEELACPSRFGRARLMVPEYNGRRHLSPSQRKRNRGTARLCALVFPVCMCVCVCDLDDWRENKMEGGHGH